MPDHGETTAESPKFDFSAFSPDTLFYDRRSGLERREARPAPPPGERRQKKERRRRIDPTTFEKQYTKDELEFMTAMQDFKVRTGKSFPTHGEVLAVARTLGYYLPAPAEDTDTDAELADASIALTSSGQVMA